MPRTATVVAHGDLDTLRVSKEGFFHLVTQFPQVGVEVISALASKLHRTTQALTAARAKLDALNKRSSDHWRVAPPPSSLDLTRQCLPAAPEGRKFDHQRPASGNVGLTR